MANALESDSALEQILLLRGLTKTTGILHEAQLLQLKLWPMVMISHATSSEAVFSYDDKSVVFNVATKGPKPKDLDKRLECLDDSVKMLFGDEYLVVVYLNGKKSFVGARKVLPPPPPNPRYDLKKFEDKVWRDNFEKELEKRAKDGAGQASGAEGKTKP
jgi:hypothetical protein